MRSSVNVWAITEAALLGLHSRRPNEKPVAEPQAARPSVGGTTGRIAVLPIFGVMGQHPDDWFADTSTELVGRVFGALVADPSVRAIVLNMNSPGGSVFGLDKLAQQVFSARGEKRIVAVSNSLMASAAYFIGAQAHEVVADPGSLTGNIGTVYQVIDPTKALQNQGIEITTITAGKFKHEGHLGVPMSAEEKESLQSMVDSYYGQFVDAVARGRNVKASAVRNGFGEGRALTAQDAKAAGLVDRVATLEEVVGKLGARLGASVNAEMTDFERRLRLSEA